MTTRFYFDVWAADDLNGDALGELTQAYDREWTRLDQDLGSGQFTINRHDSQYLDGWAAQDNLVRVRLEAGGPFDYDDARYVFAFFIENGNDELVSTDEDAGDEITRGGRDAVVILRRAVVDYQAEVDASDKYWSTALTEGVVTFLERNAGEVLRILLRNAGLRSPNPLDPSSHDFSGDGNSTPGRDSSGELWSDSDANWKIPVGMDHLEVLSMFATGGLWWRMGTDLVLHGYDADQGRDLTGSVRFAEGDNIRQSAAKEINTRETVSRALVSGETKDGKRTYRWVTDAGVESELGGRREGFVEYEATANDARLDRAGERLIASRKRRHDGPTSIGVEENRPGCPIAFDDYLPGDSITVDVPGEWDEAVVKVFGIAMSDDEDNTGEALVDVLLQESPFFGFSSDPSFSDKCCPPLTPHVPGSVQEGEPDPCWPYTGTATGLSDSIPGAVDAATNACFEPDVSYDYDITFHSADPGAYAWGWGISDTGYSLGNIVKNVANAGDGPDLHLTGTFTANPGFATHTPVSFWSNVADSVHSHRAITVTFSFAPTGFVPGADEVVRPPLTGQEVTNEAPAISIGASTTTLTLDWPYAVGSLRVRVDGRPISSASYVETTPGSGVVTLSWAIDADETVRVDYQAAT